MKFHVCLGCGKEFTPSHSNEKYCKKYCSQFCYSKKYYDDNKEKIRIKQKIYRAKKKECYERKVRLGELIEPFCECGCGCKAKVGKKFISTHNVRGKYHPTFGKHHSVESRKKISDKLRGKNHPNYGKHLSAETRKKISTKHKGKRFATEHKRKLSIAHKGKVLSAEHKKKISKANEERWQDPEYRKHMIEVAKACWLDLDYQKNMRKKLHLKPNMLEKDFNSALPKLKFVGDYSFFVGSKNPDFILPNTNVCVDLFGDHWHSLKEVQERKKYFKEFGYDLTIVWEHEWKEQREQVVSQVNSILFMNEKMSHKLLV